MLSYLDCLHECPHLVHLKNIVSGSSLPLICFDHVYALSLLHFVHVAGVTALISSFSFTTSMLLFSDVPATLFSFEFKSGLSVIWPQPHSNLLSSTSFSAFLLKSEPHFSQNFILNFNFRALNDFRFLHFHSKNLKESFKNAPSLSKNIKIKEEK